MNRQIFELNGWVCQIGLRFQFLGHFLAICEAIYPKWYKYTRRHRQSLSGDFFLQKYFADHLTFILRRVIRMRGSNVQEVVCKYCMQYCVLFVFTVLKRKKLKRKGPFRAPKEKQKKKS